MKRNYQPIIDHNAHLLETFQRCKAPSFSSKLSYVIHTLEDIRTIQNPTIFWQCCTTLFFYKKNLIARMFAEMALPSAPSSCHYWHQKAGQILSKSIESTE